MPIYEYKCNGCGRKVSLFFRSFSQVGEPACPHCNSQQLTRLISKVTVLKPWGQSLDKGPDLESLSDFDQDDPRAMREMMRRWKSEMGDEAGEEWDEAMEMVESGASPEEIDSRFDENEDSEEDDF